MLINSTWTLTVSEPTILPRSCNLELVKILHNRIGLEIGSEQIPSTSFSGICGSFLRQQDFITLQPEDFYQISLSGLKEDISKAILELNLNDSLEFLGAKLNMINREDKITSYEEIYTKLVANEPESIRKFNLQFTTPTAFAQYGSTLPLPLPSLMIRSWLERWNNFAPVYLGGDELISYFNHALILKQHRIQTRRIQMYKGYVNGFTGEVTLQILNRADALLANVADLLVQYAEFAGTGIKTRLGMGQTIVKQELRQ
ncbi:CRISPR system precrRNA processing endoribonuclease RAMP protein Cas6 [Plectonema cf. radiosum LEGE 06105]|uniref:CRISPR system precrRNA processing endoribonuclease RAMP protein Cas6 n=1 Tax=Plectonema cf. radiosum LEGE 06105 TaxID=945769 RepID=A0A8J7K442_9CYAN|nr:CRISPR system precrRNA processing endoribonuclease RAMP protein Cas6 [Plectonema radiosum]MBE9214602.1 CRISPR system precrRNA processing endoribonuclease RAMP protein Cas6 [Plectonema cf. radiosum LEGE 06105]